MIRKHDSERTRSCSKSAEEFPNDASNGFTLVEILVVLAIIGLIMSLVGPRVVKYLSSSKEQAARIQLQSFATALELYYLDSGHYPQSEDLKALIEKPKDNTYWGGPYLKSGVLPSDPWGNPYIYVFPGKHGPYDLSSFGADAIEGNGDDINGWQE